MNGPINNPLPQNGFAPAAEAKLDRLIDAAIEHKPAPYVFADFAAQVAARAAALPRPRRAAASPIGRSIAWGSAVLLGLALFALAPHATPNVTNFSFDAEILVLFELAALGWGLASGFGRRSSL